LTSLAEPYRRRAIPPGSGRHWSWLFAAQAARAALLGVYALVAEWRALEDPALESSAAHLKLAWWREELERAAAGAALHPITRYLAALPDARLDGLSALSATLDAAAAQLAGVPLEVAADLPPHAHAWYGLPLLTAARLGEMGAADDALTDCVRALAVAQYLSATLRDYPRALEAGRMPFVVADLLAAGIEDDDLAAAAPTPPLQRYLTELRRRADSSFTTADALLRPAQRPLWRHVAVLIRLGQRDLYAPPPRAPAAFTLSTLYHAWRAARRAAGGRR